MVYRIVFLSIILIQIAVVIDAILREDIVELEHGQLIDYTPEIIRWKYEDKLCPKISAELCKDQIEWNLEIQLAWIAVLLGSCIGLIEIIPTSPKLSAIRYVIYLFITLGIQISLGQVLVRFQKILRNELRRNAAIRVQEGSSKPRKQEDDLSSFQRVLLTFPKGEPTLKKSLMAFFNLLIWIGSYFLLFEY